MRRRRTNEKTRAGGAGLSRRRLFLTGALIAAALALFIGSAEAALAVEQAGPPVRNEQATEPAQEPAAAPAGPNRAFWGLAGILGLFQAYLGLSGRKCRIERVAGILDAAADELDFYRSRLTRIGDEIGAALDGPSSRLREIDPVCPFRPEFLERLRVETALDGGDRNAVRELGACHFELSLIGRDLERLGAGENGSSEEWRRLLERVETTRRRLHRTGGRVEELAGRHRARLRQIHYRIARC